MTYRFDQRGNLYPYERIPVNSLDEFEQFFVNNFPLSTTRNVLYSGLLSYLSDFGELLRSIDYRGEWLVWLNGSFTTNKASPVDIDLLNLLVEDAGLRINKPLFEPFFADRAQHTYGVDAYFLLTGESDQAKKLVTYWQTWLGTDRAGFEKGIVELTISF